MESSTKVATGIWVGQSVGDADINDFYTQGHNVPEHPLLPRQRDPGGRGQPLRQCSFPAPAQTLLKQSYSNLPNVVGQTVDQATQTLQDAGFSVSVGAAVPSNLPPDQVAAQDPGPGQVMTGSTITISPSNGQGNTVPNVVGMTMGDAANTLQKAGFQAAKGSCTVGNGDDSGTVSTSAPAANTVAPKGSTVTLNYVKKVC